MLLLYVSLLSTMGVLLARCDSPYGPWTEWSDCSVEEGQGTMIRTRACVVQDCPQPGQYTDVMVCFVKACKCKCPSPNPGFISSPTQGPEGQSSAVPEKEITNAPKSEKPSTAGSPKESSTVAGNGEEEQGSPSPTTSAEKSTISRPSEEVSAGRTLSSTETTPTAAQGKSSTSVPEEVSSTVAPGEISSTGTGEAGQGSPSPTSLITFAAIKEPTAPGLARLHHSPEIPTSAELPCEDHPLGAAKGGKLPASSFTASSSYDMFPPSQGRLNGPLAWCANEDKNGEEYLQIHLPEAENICAIATQGTGYKNGNEHVTFYFLEYSKDGHHWKFIEEDGNPKAFTGNTDSKSTAKQVLDVPVKASYIRVIPLDFKEWPCLRVEIYGKEKLKHYHPPVEIEIGEGKQGATTPTTTEESPTGLASSVTFAAIKETTEPAAGSARHHHPSKKPTSAGGPCEDHRLGAAKGGKLSPSSFTASSSFYMYPPSEGRLNGLLAWCANEDKKGEEYLQIHLPEAETICAIATQGTGYKNGNEHVTFYFLEYSKDGQHWKFIEEDRNPKVFTGNRDSKSTTKHVLDVPVKASYIRVIPLEFKEWPCLRVEIYGKEKVKHHHPPVEIEIAHGKQGSTKPTTTAEVATPRTPEYPPIPTCAAASKGIDLAIIMDSSSGVTAEEFEKLKMFVSVLVESIRSLIPQVQLGFIVYSDEPKLIMTLTPFDDVDVSKIIKDIEYTPGGHRTDLAMLKSKVNLFCHENCQDSSGCDNVMIVFTSKNTDPESLQFSFLSPIIKNATSNVIAVGMKSAVSKSELIKIALGHADHVIKLHSPDNLDSTVIHKIETLICTAKPENKGKKEDVEPPTGRLVTFRN